MAETLAPEAEPMTEDSVVIRARDITKRYGGVHALKGVDFAIHRGKVTTLFGENGAGKSTLMKILSGVEQPTSGTVELDGEPVTFHSPSDAVDRGIAIIHQELNLAPNLSVRDNIFLGRELKTAAGTIDYAAENRIVEELMEQLEEQIAPSTLIADLRLGQQQIVEIAKALASKARVLIMDEPTSALSANEVEVLFKVINDLTASGVSIVYISHHLEEALQVTDFAVVFRDGSLVANEVRANIDLPWIINTMVGHAQEHVFENLDVKYGDVALSIKDVRVPDMTTPGRLAVDGVSIDVRAGEVVCIYGLMGAGRTELLEALAGRLPLIDGSVELEGQNMAGLPIRERIARGLGLVPEDRQRDGLVQLLSVGHNMSLASLGSIVKGFWLSKSRERANVEKGIAEVRVKTSSPKAPITSLSGGNQQKVVIGKMLLTNPTVLLLDEPTRGIDVGAKGEIFALLAQEAQKGLGVLFVTSEITEALTASNRIIVMSRGRIVREFLTSEATREEVMGASGESDTSNQQIGATQ
ncbi:sugar ABC transporter ATP-binding protein [Lysinibacter cavernae]|uniref:Erythritol transport system ATP-binding protein n=1 Tax=Lysinibacter cavernae TaxID=1640652 RepID=A0A7X5R1U2_9MICO|nr:sugar ABC transporter ATP-binding protein [Lysinibacter cavernae]NIH53952.1 erythritol transport system ATP-binding protein [Lysinibacter cavernae]